MNAPINKPSTRQRALVALATTATLALGVAPAAHASSGHSTTFRQPAKGIAIRCDHLGKLTGASGFFNADEPVFDVQGHGYVYFTIAARQVTLTGPDGTTYHLFGDGYDDVVRQTMNGHSPILAEHEHYGFDILTPAGIQGRIRFTLRQGADGKVHVQDSGDCHLPKGDE